MEHLKKERSTSWSTVRNVDSGGEETFPCINSPFSNSSVEGGAVFQGGGAAGHYSEHKAQLQGKSRSQEIRTDPVD
jgi:hypothetical protein